VLPDRHRDAAQAQHAARGKREDGERELRRRRVGVEADEPDRPRAVLVTVSGTATADGAVLRASYAPMSMRPPTTRVNGAPR
jgi:hypothetical protein